MWWSRRAHDQAALEVAARLAGGRGVGLRVVHHVTSEPPELGTVGEVEPVVVASYDEGVLQEAFAGASLIVLGRDQAASRRDVVLATASVPALIIQPGIDRCTDACPVLAPEPRGKRLAPGARTPGGGRGSTRTTARNH